MENGIRSKQRATLARVQDTVASAVTIEEGPERPAQHAAQLQRRTIGIVLIPEFALISCSMTIEPLRSANFVTGQELYEWVLLSVDGGDVQSSSGIPLPTISLKDAHDKRFDLLLVVAGYHPDKFRNSALDSFLRNKLRHGRHLGAVSTGTFILARAGLLDDHRCTVHWNYKAAFEETYPDIKITEELFVVDRRVMTCAGGTAVLDMLLHYISDHAGRATARSVSEQFLVGPTRESREYQRADLRYRLGTSNQLVTGAVKLMEDNFVSPLSPSRIARRLKISQRQLERLFKQYLGCTPVRYMHNLRMNRARELLRQTDQSVIEIALCCGISDSSYFSQIYKRHFGCLPSDDRTL